MDTKPQKQAAALPANAQEDARRSAFHGSPVLALHSTNLDDYGAQTQCYALRLKRDKHFVSCNKNPQLASTQELLAQGENTSTLAAQVKKIFALPRVSGVVLNAPVDRPRSHHLSCKNPAQRLRPRR